MLVIIICLFFSLLPNVIRLSWWHWWWQGLHVTSYIQLYPDTYTSIIHSACVYIYTWKPKKTKFSVHTGLDIFFVRYGLFSKYGHVRLPSLYLQVNSFPEILDLSDGFRQYSVSSRDSIWGSMLTFAYCFFSTWCWKNTSIFWVHPNLVGNMAVFVARFGHPMTTPILLHFGLKFLF